MRPSQLALLTCSLSLTLAAEAQEPPPQPSGRIDVKVAVPRVRGSAQWGAEILRRKLLETLASEVTVVDPAAYEAAEEASTGRRDQPSRISKEGMAAAGKQAGANYVLSVEILKSGFLYTAHARLVNTANAEYQMDFKSGYYRPQAEAADRAERIARTTTNKIRILLAQAPPPPTATSTSGGTPVSAEPTAVVAVAPTGGTSGGPSSGDGPSGNDDEIFGSSSAEGDSVTRTLEESIFAPGGLEGPGGVEETERRLDELESKVQAGGRLYLRLNYLIADEDVFERSRLNSPNLLDLYIDARVNDRVRGYSQVRVFHDMTVADGAVNALGAPVDQTKFLFDQLWLKFDVGRVVYVTLGRQRVKWGVGRFWNPTDFLNPDVRDPLAVFDERLGVSLVRLHLPIESLSWNFYAIATFDETDLLKRVGGALRAEILLDSTEVTFSFAARKDGPVRLGMDVSSGLGPFDLRAEGSLTHNSQRLYYEGNLDLANGVTPTQVSYADEWIPQGLLGAEASFKYNDQDSVYLGVEYFYNGRGYKDAKLYPYIVLQDVQARAGCVGLACPSNGFQPLYMGRHYGAAYVSLPRPGDWDDSTFIGTYLANFDDGSMTARIDYQLAILSFLQMSLFGQTHFGKRGEFKFGVDLPPVAGVMGLQNGVKVADPIVDLGVGFSISF